MDSEGLLLFTNDGEFANRLMHPKHNIDKKYWVFVKGYNEEALTKLKRPIVLDGYKIKPPVVACKTTAGDKAQLEITIHEGRNRQIRRMCAAAGMRVVRLIRIAEGNVLLGDLPSGKWRYLTDEEVTALCE
jgi:23S rRNA pseudouridine2605 synthase